MMGKHWGGKGKRAKETTNWAASKKAVDLTV